MGDNKSQGENYKLRTSFLREKGYTVKNIYLAAVNFNDNYPDKTPVKIPTISTARFWMYGYRIPQLEILLELARETGTNISYLLCITDEALPEDRYFFNYHLQTLREYANLSRRELSEITGIPYNSILQFEKGLYDNPRLSTIEKFAKAFDCSIDHVMGLSDYRNWGQDLRPLTQFEMIPPGSLLHIESESIKSNALMSDDGKYFIFPSGKKLPCASNKFKTAHIEIVRRGDS